MNWLNLMEMIPIIFSLLIYIHIKLQYNETDTDKMIKYFNNYTNNSSSEKKIEHHLLLFNNGRNKKQNREIYII